MRREWRGRAQGPVGFGKQTALAIGLEMDSAGRGSGFGRTSSNGPKLIILLEKFFRTGNPIKLGMEALNQFLRILIQGLQMLNQKVK
jgi:hypothetical protein